MSRYARQTILPEVGAEGQARLSSAHVLVVGAGGLAAPVLPLLAGAGVGRITVMDGDTVDLSNLHRQTLFTQADCGRPKADVAAERCRSLNDEIDVEALKQVLTNENAPNMVAQADVILDCADSYAASYILSDTCLAQGKPLISASVLGLSGYVGGFCGGAPSLRAVFPDAPDSVASCATAGVLGPVVGTIGAMQAQMALNLILGIAPSPLGQMVQYDARTLRTSAFRFDTATEPNSCFRFVSASQLSPDDQIVELRDEAEAALPAHPNAQRIAPDRLQEIDPKQGKRLALCCASGLRAWRAAEQIQPNWPGEIVLVAASTS
ncbi:MULTISPECIES: HesA/MoeB/ThiF family protein [unclassified Ruegeria]|uniref:HesA/MoeB/ThiF family protein n=1 Tax=unclassified Ruegeria TaxID=2625375 RepID=UPI001ADAEC5D|nr:MULTISPECIES: HesA/MoeB/ThiF family protein [unclassified Ruegeria]MBO9412166.1 HesA/MoeB/ThiF family protein [Ruegeria sp. R8_1]MBO9417528.1 HesA/MoeB/ThiF family protein [Ruegeria sp. R8_2]